jgi:hypothetical protein
MQVAKLESHPGQIEHLLEGDWDEQEYDKLMQKTFNEDYYEEEEGESFEAELEEQG